MSRMMTKLTVYKCKWCGKTFKTPNLHDCKFDPDHRNCLSCRHNCGCRKFEMQGECDVIPSRIICPFHLEQDGSDGPNAFPYAKGHCQCKDYKILDGYQGSRTFAEHRDDIELGQFESNPQYDIFVDGVFSGCYLNKEEAESIAECIRRRMENGECFSGKVEVKKRPINCPIYHNPIHVGNVGGNKKKKEYE